MMNRPWISIGLEPEEQDAILFLIGRELGSKPAEDWGKTEICLEKIEQVINDTVIDIYYTREIAK